MYDPETRYLTNLTVVLGKIKSELLHTASNRPIRYKISHLIASGYPSHREEIELIYKLEEEGILEVITEGNDFFEIKVYKEKVEEKYKALDDPFISEQELVKGINKTETSLSREFEYDLAFSFAGEHRSYIEEVYSYLESKGLKVFYDKAQKSDMWGKNLVDYFEDVFKNNAKFCVMFISKEYTEKIWTNFERQIIEARSLIDKGYILPARFDSTKIEGLPETISYINLNDYTPSELGQLIVEKVTNRRTEKRLLLPSVTFRQPKIKKAFNPYEESKEWINYLITKLKSRCSQTKDIELLFSEFDRDGMKCLRIVHDGKAIYSLDITLGGMSGDAGLTFHGETGEIRSSRGTSNAWGNFEWNRDNGAVVLKLHDMSLFDHFQSDEKKFTKDEFLEELWSNIVEKIESDY